MSIKILFFYYIYMNNTKNQEQDSENAPKEQTPKNKAEQIIIIGTSKDPNFEGAIIIKIQDTEGHITGYAIRKKEDGSLEGNKISYTPDWKIGSVYQLYEADFAKLKQQGVLDSYESVLVAEKSKKIDNAKVAMLRMYLQGDKFDSINNIYPEESLMNSVEEALNCLNSTDQEKMATEFFNDTIGERIGNNRNAYKVYFIFKNTAFGQKFQQLEDERLKKAGYVGFNKETADWI